MGRTSPPSTSARSSCSGRPNATRAKEQAYPAKEAAPPSTTASQAGQADRVRVPHLLSQRPVSGSQLHWSVSAPDRLQPPQE